MHILYIGIISALRPNLCPAIPKEKRCNLKEKFASLKNVIAPVFVVILVLGVIYKGIATPTEAAAIGAFGVFVCTAIYRRLNWTIIRNVCQKTLKITCMVMWIIAAASCFNSCFIAMGARELIIKLIMGSEVNRWVVLIFMQFTLFLLGMVMDDFAIILLAAPIYVPIITALGFDRLWFGILFILNMEAAFLTPPYGFNLFYMKGIVPKEITTADLYRSVVPFVIIQMIGLALVMIFPSLATWLPSKLIE
ncbi:MAG TPA: TRAP transporter large permease subunit [Candidatus Atribacteria bacterium]|nr:TRAP transporter large permease subunit [Candidatus Atribacteria bacterium]